ncbi:o-succinylbenzoate--CoA ligase [Propioniciclava sp.]|uniref:o-succinylbenzoate--CoA ligase n=1 Tax=Propioniciclava sp. TaxID=2038686 RepID=UPI0026205618|nr:o-succinylbenzoate--CoA ligase [Propioniciclava sp.]
MPVLLSGHPDPVAAFDAAHAAGRRVAVRTSGTSAGRPRTLVRTTASWVDSFAPVAGRLGLGSTDRLWIPGPLDATMNLFAACVARSVGASWGSDAAGATWAQLTPTGLATLLDDGPPPAASLRGVLVAGDGLGHRLSARAGAAGLEVHHYYGAAELSLVAWGTSAADLHLFDQVEAQVRNGVLWVRSPWLSDGPAPGSPAGAWQRDADGFATVDDHTTLAGTHVRVLGRPGWVTTGGSTVALAPVAAALSAHTTAPVRLVGVPHAALGHVLTAVVATSDDLAAARRWARAHLAGAERPRRWLVHPRPPTTPAGKVDPVALAHWAAAEVAR